MTIEIIEGDCREVLKEMPDQSVNCIVTSPPYFGLRDYGVENQMGLEPTPAEFVEALVGVMREARRVLRDDGTLWLNLGDSYAGAGYSNHSKSDGYNAAQKSDGGKQSHLHGTGLPAKNLIGIPWRVAFALQADGWYLRQDIIWHKPNPMPESVRDRCTKAHEYIFLLSKSPTYYFDNEAIKEPRTSNEDANTFRGGAYVNNATFNNSAGGKRRVPGNKTHKQTTAYEAGDERLRTKAGFVAYAERERAADPTDLGTRNKRDVWTVAPKPFKEAHFATFPPDLIEPCVLAGCPEGGTVLDPFFGAGTTGIVCQRTNRACIGIELNPEYYDIASRRLWPEEAA